MSVKMSQNTIAAILMVLAVLCFSFMDAFARGLGQDIPPLQIVWARYYFQLALTVIILAPRLGSLLKTSYPKLQLLRSFFLFGASVCFFTGLKYMKLADLTAIFEVAPLIITVLAIFVLKERVGPLRILAVVIGLVGAMIIIQPGSASFSAYAIYGLLAALCFAAYAVSTRFLGSEESPWTSFLYTALIGSLIASIIVPFVWQRPELIHWIKFVVMGASGMVGHYLIIRALNLGEASYLAPFGYSSLVFNGLWGFIFYAERPELNVYLGGALIVLAGLFVWWRELGRAKDTSSLASNQDGARP